MSTVPARTQAAWQAALAAEHQAYFAYDLLGPRLPRAQQPLARTCQSAHAALRDATALALTSAGATPVAPEADYPALYPVADAAAARRVAVRVEDAAAAAWRFLFAQAPAGSPVRTAAQGGLTDSAVRATRWRTLTDPSTATQPFPGI